MQPKAGGKLHPKLNIGARPIANKYREGKVKSTLKRESKRPRNRWEGSARWRAESVVELSRGACASGATVDVLCLCGLGRWSHGAPSCGTACSLSARTRQRGLPRARRSGWVGASSVGSPG